MIGLGGKGLSTKLHLALSAGGIQSACLSEGQRVDMKVFSKLWELGASGWKFDMLLQIKDMIILLYVLLIKKAEKIPVIPRRAIAHVLQ